MERQTEPLTLKEKVLIAVAGVSVVGLLGGSLYDPPTKTDEQKWEEYLRNRKPETELQSAEEKPTPKYAEPCRIDEILESYERWDPAANHFFKGWLIRMPFYPQVVHTFYGDQPLADGKIQSNENLTVSSKRDGYNLIDKVNELLVTSATKDTINGKEYKIPGEVTILAYGTPEDAFMKEILKRVNSPTATVPAGEAFIEGYKCPSGARILLVIGSEQMAHRAATILDGYFKAGYQFDRPRARIMSTSPADIEVKLEK